MFAFLLLFVLLAIFKYLQLYNIRLFFMDAILACLTQDKDIEENIPQTDLIYNCNNLIKLYHRFNPEATKNYLQLKKISL